MKKLIFLNTFIACLAVAFLITAKYSVAGIGFQIGPDGDAYKLIDCSIPENNSDPSKCANTQGPTGAISWESARERALDMTFEGFPCDLAAPSTEAINNFLKNFPGFLDACNDCGEDFELCAWFGARDPTLSEPPGPGPYLFVNDQFNDIPCPFIGDCDPVVNPGVGTSLTFQDWCRTSNGCQANEPNGPALQDGQFYLVYLSYLNIGGPVAWADCQDFQCPSQQCQPLSYFVECELPVPTITLTPETATNDILTEHTVTATILLGESPVVDVLVDFNILSGPNAGEMSDPNEGECTPNDDCTTDANGEVSWTYSSKLLGTDTIVASFFDEFVESDIESNAVEKIWVITRNVPTLSEWGLIAMAGILGIIGLFALRKRKAAA